MINWDNVTARLKNGREISPRPELWNTGNPEYKDIYNLWKKNNFNIDVIKWTNFYDCKEEEAILCDELQITPLRSWISCVKPGYMTAPHYDVDDNEAEYKKYGNIKRYSVFISKPSVGHLFILRDEYHFNNPQGTVLKWNHYRDWHNGINGSFEDKFMFHILGY